MAPVAEKGSWQVVQSVYVEEDDGMEDMHFEKTHDTEAGAKAFAWSVFAAENPDADPKHADWRDDDEDFKTLHYNGGDANLWIVYVDEDGAY